MTFSSLCGIGGRTFRSSSSASSGASSLLLVLPTGPEEYGWYMGLRIVHDPEGKVRRVVGPTWWWGGMPDPNIDVHRWRGCGRRVSGATNQLIVMAARHFIIAFSPPVCVCSCERPYDRRQSVNLGSSMEQCIGIPLLEDSTQVRRVTATGDVARVEARKCMKT